MGNLKWYPSNRNYVHVSSYFKNCLVKFLSKFQGQPPVKRAKRSTQQLQSRLLSLCVARRDNKKIAVEVPEGLGHIIRF